MHFSADMLSAARNARACLGAARERVLGFALGCLQPGGGFRGRDAEADLYYTVFGIDCLLALGEEPGLGRTEQYLRRFGDGRELDLLHLSCLARCWRRLPGGAPDGVRDSVARAAAAHRAADGGYALTPGSPAASVYGCFVALSALQDAGLRAPQPEAVARAVQSLRVGGGGYANEAGHATPATNATAGALLVMRACGAPVPPGAAEWLCALHDRRGGFRAGPGARVPDLVSTATALFALRAAGADLKPLRAACLSFVETLWHDEGGFSGNWLDDTPDCEHTFHALLSFGCLSADAARDKRRNAEAADAGNRPPPRGRDSLPAPET